MELNVSEDNLIYKLDGINWHSITEQFLLDTSSIQTLLLNSMDKLSELFILKIVNCMILHSMYLLKLPENTLLNSVQLDVLDKFSIKLLLKIVALYWNHALPNNSKI